MYVHQIRWTMLPKEMTFRTCPSLSIVYVLCFQWKIMFPDLRNSLLEANTILKFTGRIIYTFSKRIPCISEIYLSFKNGAFVLRVTTDLAFHFWRMERIRIFKMRKHTNFPTLIKLLNILLHKLNIFIVLGGHLCAIKLHAHIVQILSIHA